MEIFPIQIPLTAAILDQFPNTKMGSPISTITVVPIKRSISIFYSVRHRRVQCTNTQRCLVIGPTIFFIPYSCASAIIDQTAITTEKFIRKTVHYTIIAGAVFIKHTPSQIGMISAMNIPYPQNGIPSIDFEVAINVILAAAAINRAKSTYAIFVIIHKKIHTVSGNIGSLINEGRSGYPAVQDDICLRIPFYRNNFPDQILCWSFQLHFQSTNSGHSLCKRSFLIDIHIINCQTCFRRTLDKRHRIIYMQCLIVGQHKIIYVHRCIFQLVRFYFPRNIENRAAILPLYRFKSNIIKMALSQ